VLDRGLDLGESLRTSSAPYITVGFAALLFACPARRHVHESLDASIGTAVAFAAQAGLRRRLLGSVHFLWQVKADWREPALYIAAYAALMAWRWVKRPHQVASGALEHRVREHAAQNDR
jgi:DMSO/TMAO reductase YedYZ heme-binding membrane subunit